MPKCPECNTYAYDETSSFCYRCGAQLPVHFPEKESIPEKKKKPSQNYTTTSPPVESSFEKTDVSLKLVKSDPTQKIQPVEICAQCGGLIKGKNRIFCSNCESDNRESVSEEMSPVFKHTFPKSPIKSPGNHENPYIRTNVQEPISSEVLSVQEVSTQSSSSASSWRSVFILAAMALLFLLILLLLPFLILI
jgi:hypothetical protein